MYARSFEITRLISGTFTDVVKTIVVFVQVSILASKRRPPIANPTIMKTLFLILIILFSLTGYSQTNNLDSLKQRILMLEANQESIQFNLTKAHNRYRTGLMITITGIAMTWAGAAAGLSGADGNSAGLLTLGSIVSTVGSVILIDSHKFIGRAGKRKFSGR
jgi:hypothetical protein